MKKLLLTLLLLLPLVSQAQVRSDVTHRFVRRVNEAAAGECVPAKVGWVYFDISLNKQRWCNGIAWGDFGGGTTGGGVESVNGETGVVLIGKIDVGLGSVDNTSDLDKPISTAVQGALNAKQNTLVSGTNIRTVAGNSLLGSGNVVLTKSDVGLSNVDNTSDAAKPVSTATQSALDAKAAVSHTHAVSDVTNLQTTLNGKQNLLVSGTSIKTLNGESLLGSGDITVSGSGGTDPWVYVKITSDFTTSSATAVDITTLAFTPGANKNYIVEGQLLLRTATATVGPRPGVAWPTGLTDGAVTIKTPSSATAEVQQHGNINAAVLAPVGGLPTTTGSYLSRVDATVVAGASPSGTFRLQLASETAGTVVTAKAGSWIRYREF